MMRALVATSIFNLIFTIGVSPARAEDTIASRVEVGTGYSNLQAAHDHGDLFRLRGAYRITDFNTAELEAKSLTRVFEDGTRFQDTGAALGLISRMSKRTYIENRAFVAPDAKILPQWSAQSIPFVSLPNNFEYGTSLTYSHYLYQDVFTLSPILVKLLEPSWMLGARADITRTFNTIGAGQLFAQYSLLGRWITRLTLAAGRSVEDTALQADFNSQSLSTKYVFGSRYAVELIYSNYASDIRKEQSYGIGFGWGGR